MPMMHMIGVGPVVGMPILYWSGPVNANDAYDRGGAFVGMPILYWSGPVNANDAYDRGGAFVRMPIIPS